MPIITYLNRKSLVLGEVGGLDSKSILYGLYSQWILTPASGRLVQLTKKSKMVDPIQIVAHVGIDKDFLTQIRTWANEVLERTGSLPPCPYLCIRIWKTIERFQAFYREEKEALGVITGEETDFLATHDAWRGYPRIHICQERLKGISSAIFQGIVHHETSHALHHGTPEFYTFRFSSRLQEMGRSYGLDLPLLQQCVYFLSVALKDREVIQWLAEIGLGFGQIALLEHLISDTEEERQMWEVVRGFSALRKIALAAFLKTFLPIEAMISVGIEEVQSLRNQWDGAYRWLSERDREGLSRLAQWTLNPEGNNFQERLEQAVLRLITQF